MNEGNSENGFQPLSMEEALRLAREDKELRSEIFLERLHLQAGNGERKGAGRKGAASSSPEGDGGKKGDGRKGKPVRKPTTKDKGGKKGSGKGDRKPGAGKKLSSSYNGKAICFAYNNKREECREGANCTRAHVCQYCQGEPPLFKCTAA